MTLSARSEPVGASPATKDLTTDHQLVRFAIGASTAIAVVLVAAKHRDDPLTAFGLVGVVLTYGFLSVIDVAEQRLPNRITLPLAGLTCLVVLTAGVASEQLTTAAVAITTGLGFSVLLGVLRFGMGDVKLAVTVGTIAGWFGRDAILATIYIGAAGGAVAALLLMVLYRRRDVSFSFGPFLAIGSVAGMLLAS